MASRHGDKNRSDSPGPGAYSPLLSTEGPNYSVGKGRRDSSNNRHSMPGPGAYDNRPWTAETVGSCKFGSGSRRPFSANQTTPGPGAYENKSWSVNKGMYKFGSSTRRPLSAGSHAPGPGAYNAAKKFDGPAYSMRPKTLKDKFTDVPGPGTYDQSPKRIVHDSVIGGKFGNSARSSTDKFSNPVGPGMYDTRGKFGGPKWGFGSSSRGDFDKTDSPGPGSYNLKPTVPDVPYYYKI